MANSYFQFKKFTVYHERSAMKVTTDACLFGAWTAEALRNAHAQGILLDIGTGTGLLSLMVAQKNNLQIDAVEINPAAAKEAEGNIIDSPFKERIYVHQIDIALFEKSNYDYIICNPPFYENELISPSVDKNIAHHSHQLKWKDLFQIIHNKLNPKGYFYLLIPSKRKEEAENGLLKQELFITTLVSVKQTPNHAPFRIIIKGSKNKEALHEDDIIIRDEHDQYTPKFTSLLKDYYLYL